MRAESAPAWGHGRHLTGRAHGLSIVVAGERVPVTAPRTLTTAGFADDEHAGGPDRAVTVHPWEHYAAWLDAGRPTVDEPAFGEQLTSIGLVETEVFVGDTFRWGTAEVTVGAPALVDPSLAERLRLPGLAEQILRSGRTGFHLRVVRSGRVGPDDALELVDVEPAGVSLATVSRALVDGPVAAGVSAQRLLMVRELLPAALVTACARMIPRADQPDTAARQTVAG